MHVLPRALAASADSPAAEAALSSGLSLSCRRHSRQGEPCIRANDLEQGFAFEFETDGAITGLGTYQVDVPVPANTTCYYAATARSGPATG